MSTHVVRKPPRTVRRELDSLLEEARDGNDELVSVSGYRFRELERWLHVGEIPSDVSPHDVYIVLNKRNQYIAKDIKEFDGEPNAYGNPRFVLLEFATKFCGYVTPFLQQWARVFSTCPMNCEIRVRTRFPEDQNPCWQCNNCLAYWTQPEGGIKITGYFCKTCGHLENGEFTFCPTCRKENVRPLRPTNISH